MMNQPSFGKVIVDERGIRKLKDKWAKDSICCIFRELKASLGKFKGSEQADVLVHPFQEVSKESGIKVVTPTSERWFWCKGGDLSLENVQKYIQSCLDEPVDNATTFEEQAKRNNVQVPGWLLNVKKWLPLSVSRDRYAANLSIKID